MINWKLFTEEIDEARPLLINETDTRPAMTGIRVGDLVNDHNGDEYTLEDMVEENREWEYVDQLQSKQKEIEIDGHGNKMTVSNG